MKTNPSTYLRPGRLPRFAATVIAAAAVCVAHFQLSAGEQTGSQNQNASIETKTMKGRIVPLADYLSRHHLSSGSKSSPPSSETVSDGPSASNAFSRIAAAAQIRQPIALIAEDTGLLSKVTPGKQMKVYILMAQQDHPQGIQALQTMYQQVSGTTSAQTQPASSASASPGGASDARESASAQSSETGLPHKSEGRHAGGPYWQVTGKVLESGSLRAIFVQSASPDTSAGHEMKAQEQEN